MKKILAMSLWSLFVLSNVAMARTIYDSKNQIIYNDTIRGHRQAAKAKAEREKKLQAAAAARLDYEAALKTLEKPQPKTNFWQDRIEQ